MAAFKRVVDTKDSFTRIKRMLRGERLYEEQLSEEEAADRREQMKQVKVGREIVMGMEEHDRFEFMYQEMGWDEESLAYQKNAIVRSHAFRLSILFLLVLLMPAIVYKFGWWVLFYTLSLSIYLCVVCLKSTCFYTQLDERALWSFKQLRERRPKFWLYKRAFWYLN